jgi:hypothetical protein
MINYMFTLSLDTGSPEKFEALYHRKNLKMAS